MIIQRLLLIVILIAINAFFVTTEFAIVSVRRSRINQLVAAGDVQAKTVQQLQRSLERLLSTTQIGITLSSIALGGIGTNTLANLLHHGFFQLPINQQFATQLDNYLSLPLAFLLIAYLQIVLGELCPKAVALLYGEQIARYLASPSLAIARCFKPFIWILNQSTRFLLKLVGINYTGLFYHHLLTSEELEMIITTDKESTGLEEEERELLRNVFAFGDVLASEVMVTRNHIYALNRDATFQDLLLLMSKNNYSAYPVIGESLDDIQGIIYFKQLAQPLCHGEIAHDTLITPWICPAKFIPEFTEISELLPLMQEQKEPMMIVVDEFGVTVGLITLNDIIAQIIGNDINQNHQNLAVQKVDLQTFIVQAQMNLEEVNETLGLNLPLIDEYQTLGGFLLYQFQKMPAIGEIMHFDNLEIQIISGEGKKLDLIQIYIKN
jgi:CBS domain containing-hemolysin-like protein